MCREILHFVTLASTEGLGCRNAHRLLDFFKSPDALFSASVSDLIQQGIPEFVAKSLLSERIRLRAEAELRRCHQNDVQVLSIQDDCYPRFLKEIYDPPLILYVKGNLQCLNFICLSIVGSRRASPYGINAAENLARHLARSGLTICSGLARGIDSAAHRGALEGEGQTIAVLGSGMDHIYPRENKKLAAQIEKNGCLVSEFPMGTGPVPQNFPIRNRIISGLSFGTCLVEAAEFSGSLITARLALEQGREVFAVPGNITSKNSFGPNLWIKQGAKLVQSWEDIVEELPSHLRAQLWPGNSPPGPRPQPSLLAEVLTDSERSVLELLRHDEAIHVDHLLETSGMTSSELLCTLSELEMKEKIKQLPGKVFVRRF